MNAPRRTKIVTTIGPATRSVEGMIELIEAGADVFRLNFSHGTRDDHAENVAMTREASERSGKEIGILGDLPGPKLRIGDVDEGIVGLRPGSEIVLTTEDCVGSEERLSVSYDGLPEAVSAATGTSTATSSRVAPSPSVSSSPIAAISARKENSTATNERKNGAKASIRRGYDVAVALR